MSKKYAIDLPNPHDLEDVWVTYNHYDSFEDALRIAKHLMGADDKGRINVISEFDNEEVDDEQD